MTVNEAIAKVLSTQFKKDMGEALEIVTGAGYQVEKWNGYWMVRNPETNRTLVLSGNGYRTYLQYGSVTTLKKVVDEHLKFVKFDFEGNLRKPINRDWYYLKEQRMNDRSDTKIKYDNLDWKKRTLKWRREDVEKTKKRIMELQKQLFDDMESVIRAEKDLERLRRDLNLIK